MTETKIDLPPYGQPAAWDAPPGTSIWGARWIWPDDMVYNRQGFNDQPGVDALSDWLNGRVGGSNRIELAMKAVPSSGLQSTSKEPVTLYEDERGIIRGNPNASYGYLYVAAWLKPTTPEVHP